MTDTPAFDPLEPDDLDAPPARSSSFSDRPAVDATVEPPRTSASHAPARVSAKPSGPSIASVLAAIAAAALLFTAGFALARLLGTEGREPNTGDETAAADRLGGRVEEVESALSRLSADVSKSFERIETRLPADPKADLDALKAKVDGVSEAVKALRPPDLSEIAAGQKGLAAGQSEADKKLAALSTQISSVERELATLKPPPLDQQKPSSTAKPLEDELTTVAGLLTKNQFVEARDTLAHLRETSPADARTWYFSAIATGLADNAWNGESQTLVNVGLSLEKAKRPQAAQIEAALTKLTVPGAKNWIDGYRARLR